MSVDDPFLIFRTSFREGICRVPHRLANRTTRCNGDKKQEERHLILHYFLSSSLCILYKIAFLLFAAYSTSFGTSDAVAVVVRVVTSSSIFLRSRMQSLLPGQNQHLCAGGRKSKI